MVRQVRNDFENFKAEVLRILKESYPDIERLDPLNQEVSRLQLTFTNQSTELVELRKEIDRREIDILELSNKGREERDQIEREQQAKSLADLNQIQDLTKQLELQSVQLLQFQD